MLGILHKFWKMTRTCHILGELSNHKNIQNNILEAETLQKYLVFLQIVCVLGGNGRVRLSEGMYRGVIGFKFIKKMMLIH